MKKRFVVFMPAASKDQELAFVASLGSAGWWHHLSGCWLVVDHTGTLTAEVLRDRIGTISTDLLNMVVSVADNGEWAARLMPDALDSSRSWFASDWF